MAWEGPVRLAWQRYWGAEPLGSVKCRGARDTPRAGTNSRLRWESHPCAASANPWAEVTTQGGGGAQAVGPEAARSPRARTGARGTAQRAQPMGFHPPPPGAGAPQPRRTPQRRARGPLHRSAPRTVWGGAPQDAAGRGVVCSPDASGSGGGAPQDKPGSGRCSRPALSHPEFSEAVSLERPLQAPSQPPRGCARRGRCRLGPVTVAPRRGSVEDPS